MEGLILFGVFLLLVFLNVNIPHFEQKLTYQAVLFR